MHRHRQHIQDGNGIHGRVIFTELPQALANLCIDYMDIFVKGFKPVEIRRDAAAFFVNEILGQEKHCGGPVNCFLGIGKGQVVPGHRPEKNGMGAAACRDDQPQQRT